MGSNCVASTSIGCLFCCKGCSAEKVRNAFTFVPPRPSYTVEADAEDKSKGRIVYSMDVLHNSVLYRQAADSAEVRWLTTRKGSRVPIVWIHQGGPQSGSQAASADQCGADTELPSAAAAPDRPPPLVLLHCHGNATDIGMMMGPYLELAKVLGIEVVGVEYSGYGAASGKPSSGNTYADVEAAYDLVVASGVPPNRIVAYGQSVGSGPVAHLAVKRPLCGIILHSPLLSGIKVVDPQPDSCCRPSCVWRCFDFYPNDRSIRQLQCPAFIMHGQRDDIIPFYHGYRLHQACPKASRWPGYFPPRAGHNDLVETDMRMYFGEISNFLQDLRKIAAGLKVEPPSEHRPRQAEMRGPAGAPRPAPQAPAQPEEPQAAAAAARWSDLGGVAPAAAEAAQAAPVAADADVPTAAKGHSSEVSEAAASALDPGASEAVEDFIGAAPEPKAGPEDGRYEQMRRGNFLAPPPEGQSVRQLEAVESAPEAQ